MVLVLKIEITFLGYLVGIEIRARHWRCLGEISHQSQDFRNQLNSSVDAFFSSQGASREQKIIEEYT